MKSSLFISIFLVIALKATGQWYDNNWILGYDFESNASLSETMKLSFDNQQVAVKNFPLKLDFAAANLTISKENGDFFFYTNGIRIHDNMDNLMQGGDSLNFGTKWPGYAMYGYPVQDGIIMMPLNDSIFFLLHLLVEYNFEFGQTFLPALLYSIVNSNIGEKGSVILKNKLIKTIVDFEFPAATKHANGQDWWIIVPHFLENKFFTFGLAQGEIIDTLTQHIGYKPPWQDSMDLSGQNVFSPDGSIYVDNDGRNGIRIFDFDRCTGELSNFRWIHLPLTGNLLTFGAAISPNSRFLYITSREYVEQYDLQANDIAASKEIVAVYDGFQLPSELPTYFYSMQLAPNGKIIINGAATKYLHVINHPNEKGIACDVRQHILSLPQYTFSTPIYPHYRLGSIDGSPCDTLGIDNHPLARYTWEADTVNSLLVQFTDNSFYQPTQWSWDFGDGGSSNEINPTHTFPADGTYTVCLTVSNQYDSDTWCQAVTVGATSTQEDASTGVQLSVYPNPASDVIHLSCQLPPGKTATWKLFDALGREIKSERLQAGITARTCSLEGVPSGMYFHRLEIDGVVIQAGKLTVVSDKK